LRERGRRAAYGGKQGENGGKAAHANGPWLDCPRYKGAAAPNEGDGGPRASPGRAKTPALPAFSPGNPLVRSHARPVLAWPARGRTGRVQQMTSQRAEAPAGPRSTAVLIYLVAFVTGGIVMSFEMLGSRYRHP